MKALIEKCVEGANTRDLCKLGDDLIEKEISSSHKKMKKGSSKNEKSYYEM